MNAKLQELTEKIYQEGVQKGQTEAEKIIADARLEAKKIISEATSEAERQLTEAHKKSDELQKNVNSELQMAFRQTLTSLKQHVAGLIATKASAESVTAAVQSEQFLLSVLTTAAGQWQSNSGTIVQLPESLALETRKFLEAQIARSFTGGLTIEYVKEIRAGFIIQPSDGSYKISFTDESLTSFFKGFLRPKLVEMLYQ